MLRQLLKYGELHKEEIRDTVRKEFHSELSQEAYKSAINVLSGGFMNTQSEKKKFADIEILKYDAERTYTRLRSYDQGATQLAFIRQMNDLMKKSLNPPSEMGDQAKPQRYLKY